MKYRLIPLSEFEKNVKSLAKKYPSLKNDLKDFLCELEKNPEQGVEIAPGIRKIRMKITSKGRGKSGGARIITFNLIVSQELGEVYLINIYDKSEFSTIDKDIIKQIIQEKFPNQ